MELEILAPAGNMEMLIAAVRCGANAVYLGTKNMNARRNADNFDFEQLFEAVKYCHQRNVKVYVTANTLVSDNEMYDAYKTVRNAMECGVDGFIVQDLGLAKMIREHFPQARLHASTQCSVNTPEGFKQLENMGFCRGVLPREMSLEEIKEIRKSTDMELEIFVHGALCMCVSGQCYLSAMLGGRSGNRGLCAQPCRLSFSADNTNSCDLSLKDLSLIDKIKDISSAGVVSLKIEGRMKRPEYVAAAVTACKKAIENKYSAYDEAVLKSVFSRSGFTDGYFSGNRYDMFGIRKKEDVVAAKDVLKELSHLYDNENPIVPVDIELTFKAEQPMILKISTQGKAAVVTGEVPEKAINKPLDEDALRTRITKLGGTGYYANSVKINCDEGLIAPASKINELRRIALEKLGKTEIPTVICKKFEPIKQKTNFKTPYYTARFDNPQSIPDKHPFKRVFIPIWSSDEDFVDNRAGVEIPRGLFSMEEKLKARLEHLKKIGVKNALCGNLGGYALAEKLGFNVYGDFGLNVFNGITAKIINNPILSFELTVDKANAIECKGESGIIAYGKLPLMITRNCPIKNHIGCENCGKNGELTDRKGYKFKVKCSQYPCVEILNPVPICMSDRINEIKTDFMHFYFTSESKNQVEEIIELYKNGKKPDFKYTRGLYYRGVM